MAVANPPLEAVLGADLRPGDIIIPWYEKTAVITAIEPYAGPLAGHFRDGAAVCKFQVGGDFGAKSMLIELGAIYKRVLR